ncbi:hypothetical protein IJ579_06960 [bacterium]|nr:hypothetical protein [bacterium]
MNVTGVSSRLHRLANSVSDKIVDHIPAFTPSSKKVLNTVKWIGNRVSSPQNRLILGVTALMSQPFIDLYNTNVDERTREVSAARTVAKIIAGTATGFTIRYMTIAAIDKFEKFFKPTIFVQNMKQYKMALGSILALWVMVGTNFLIDAPLTQYLTNKFINKIDQNHASKAAKTKEVSNG